MALRHVELALTVKRIDAHEDSNAIVITAEPDMMRSLEEVVRQLDIRRAQVQVEAIIVEVFSDGTLWVCSGCQNKVVVPSLIMVLYRGF